MDRLYHLTSKQMHFFSYVTVNVVDFLCRTQGRRIFSYIIDSCTVYHMICMHHLFLLCSVMIAPASVLYLFGYFIYVFRLTSLAVSYCWYKLRANGPVPKNNKTQEAVKCTWSPVYAVRTRLCNWSSVVSQIEMMRYASWSIFSKAIACEYSMVALWSVIILWYTSMFHNHKQPWIFLLTTTYIYIYIYMFLNTSTIHRKC